MLQLACANPGLRHALFAYQLHNGLMLIGLSRFSSQALVIGLTADADKATGLGDAYSKSFFFGKGTLEGFFGSFTPYSF